MLKEEVIAKEGSAELPALHPPHSRLAGAPEFRAAATRAREQFCDRLGSVVRALARRLR